MCMRRTFFFCAFLALAAFSTAIGKSDATINGTLLDAEDGGPIPGAVVRCVRSDTTLVHALTDVRGRFAIAVPLQQRGDLTLTVESIGYVNHAIPLADLDVTSPLTIRLTPHAGETDPIIIIGRSSAKQARDVGTSTLISPKTIRLVNPIGTQEMLSYVPGVNGFSDDGMGNSRLNIGMRGLNPRRSARVLVLEDGIPIQPAPYIYPNMYYNPPTERIERIEVLKGSAALEHGPQTMGGVINYVTGRPRTAPGGRVMLTGGTNGFGALYGEVGGIGSKDLRGELGLLVKRGDGFRENNGFLQLNGTLKLIALPSDDRIVYIKANGNHESSEATYTGLTSYSFENDPAFNPKEDDEFTVNRLSLDVILSDRLGDESSAMTRAYINYFDRDWWREDDVFYRADDFERLGTDATPVPWFEPGDLVRAGNDRTNFGILRQFVSLGVERTWKLIHGGVGDAASIRFGGRLHFERFLDHRVAGTAPDARTGDFFRVDPSDSTITVVGSNQHYETIALSAFARESVDFGSLTLSGGLRIEAFEQEQIDRMRGSIYTDKTSVVLLPGFGINYGIGPVNLFAGLHRGYTPPSSGAIKVSGLVAASNEGLDLRPEKSWNAEIGLRASTDLLGVEVAGFGVEIEDMVAAGRGTIFRNLGRVRSVGIESSVALRGDRLWSPLPTFNVAATLLRTEVLDGEIPSAVLAGDVPVDISGNELPYAPQLTVNAGVAREAGKFSLRADAHFVSSSYTDFENIETTSSRGDTGPIPSHLTFSAAIRFTPNDTWSVSLVGKNLTDEIYVGSRLHSNPRQPEAGQSSGIIPGSRRQVNLGVEYNFGAL